MKKSYISDATNFITNLINEKPHIRKDQIAARKVWWDKKQDFEERERISQQKLPKKPYDYY